MGDSLNVPTCVLKVNVQCCAACSMKVKKKLQKINGVYAIDIDTKNGLVSVRGTVQPPMLIRIISEKLGKKAELYANEKDPKIQSKMLDQRNCFSPSKHEKNNKPSSFPDESNDYDKGKDDHDRAVHNEVNDNIPEGIRDTPTTWHEKEERRNCWLVWQEEYC